MKHKTQMIPCKNTFTQYSPVLDKIAKNLIFMDVLGEAYCKATKIGFDKIFKNDLSKYFGESFEEYSNNRKQKKFFKLTDLVYGLINKAGRLNIYMIDSDIGFSTYGKDKVDSDWNIRLGVIAKYAKDTTNTPVDVIKIYQVNNWFVKTTEMKDYNEESLTNVDFYKMFESFVIDVPQLLTDTDLDNEERFSNQCKICSEKKKCEFDTNDILTVAGVSHKLKIHALQEQLTREDLPNIDVDKLSQYDRSVGMNNIHNERELTEDMIIGTDFYIWFENHPLNTVPEHKVAMFDFETTTPLLPIITNIRGGSDLPLVISINNKGYLSPLLYSKIDHELNHYNWCRDFITELNTFQICVAYNASFEKKQIKAIIKWIDKTRHILPDTVEDTIEQAESVIKKIIEIADPFKKKMIKIRGLYSGWSLKNIIEPFTGATPYGEQTDAVYKLRDVLMYRWFGVGYNKEYIEEILQEVESYCDSDTEELWNILEKYKELQRKNHEKKGEVDSRGDVYNGRYDSEHLPF